MLRIEEVAMIDFCFRVAGIAALLIVAILFAGVGAMLVFADNQLPEGVDDTVLYSRFSDHASISVIQQRDEKGENQRIAVLNEDWAFALNIEGDASETASLLDRLPSTAPPFDNDIFYIPISRYYVTDFASVPRWLHWLIQPFGAHAEASIVHDWLYAIGGDEAERKTADDVFYAALVQAGVARKRARLMYAAVRIFGERGFGRENEWNGRFYNPLANVELSGDCIIGKPEDPKTIQEFDTIDFQTSTREEVRIVAPSLTPFETAWAEIFSRPACARALLDGRIAKAEWGRSFEIEKPSRPALSDEDKASAVLEAERLYAIEEMTRRLERNNLSECAVINEARRILNADTTVSDAPDHDERVAFCEQAAR